MYDLKLRDVKHSQSGLLASTLSWWECLMDLFFFNSSDCEFFSLFSWFLLLCCSWIFRLSPSHIISSPLTFILCLGKKWFTICIAAIKWSKWTTRDPCLQNEWECAQDHHELQPKWEKIKISVEFEVFTKNGSGLRFVKHLKVSFFVCFLREYLSFVHEMQFFSILFSTGASISTSLVSF